MRKNKTHCYERLQNSQRKNHIRNLHTGRVYAHEERPSSSDSTYRKVGKGLDRFPCSDLPGRFVRLLYSGNQE